MRTAERETSKGMHIPPSTADAPVPRDNQLTASERIFAASEALANAMASSDEVRRGARADGAGALVASPTDVERLLQLRSACEGAWEAAWLPASARLARADALKRETRAVRATHAENDVPVHVPHAGRPESCRTGSDAPCFHSLLSCVAWFADGAAVDGAADSVGGDGRDHDCDGDREA